MKKWPKIAERLRTFLGIETQSWVLLADTPSVARSREHSGVEGAAITP